MNYRVNQKTKTISIYGELAENEKAVIDLLIKAGYMPKPAETKRRVRKADILKWFDKNNDTKGKETFEKNITEKGYLKAVPLFKKAFPNAWDEIKSSIN